MNKDKQILDFMFDPYLIEYSFSDFLTIGDQEQTIDDNDGLDPKDQPDNELKSKELELKAVQLANQNEFDGALDYFQQALSSWPENASALNNRAQVYRLLNRVDDAKVDLDQAIQLSNERHGCKVARQAYCQRALIHLLNDDKEQGLKDMAKSADLGNRFARSYMAKMNPYAALCNQMLQDMFQQFNKKPLVSKEQN